MKSSKILDNCDFIALLRSSLNTQFTIQEQMLLDVEYDRFLARIERVVQGGKSKLEKLRILTRTGETLERLKLNIKDQTSSRYLYAQSAGSILDFEKRAILLQLKYPGLSEGAAARKAPFRLSKKYTPTDLMEILTPSRRKPSTASYGGIAVFVESCPANIKQQVECRSFHKHFFRVTKLNGQAWKYNMQKCVLQRITILFGGIFPDGRHVHRIGTFRTAFFCFSTVLRKK